jgi:hypothetical protein
MFSPGLSTQERDRKVDVGMTALLTMSIILLMLVDLMPKSQISALPWMGRLFCITNRQLGRQMVFAVDHSHLSGNGRECGDHALAFESRV